MLIYSEVYCEDVNHAPLRVSYSFNAHDFNIDPKSVSFLSVILNDGTIL